MKKLYNFSCEICHLCPDFVGVKYSSTDKSKADTKKVGLHKGNPILGESWEGGGLPPECWQVNAQEHVHQEAEHE
jgi:hypothetical protein